MSEGDAGVPPAAAAPCGVGPGRRPNALRVAPQSLPRVAHSPHGSPCRNTRTRHSPPLDSPLRDSRAVW